MTRRALATFLCIALASPALAETKLLICYPGAPGDTKQAQPTMNALAEELTKRWGIADATTAVYVNDLDEGKKILDEQKPSFGILSLSTWVAWKKSGVPMKLIATGTRAKKPTQRYHVVVPKSGSAKSLGDLKGKKVPSNHAADERFVREVIFDGAPETKDVTFEQKPLLVLRSLRKCAKGEVDAVLIDDDQLAFLNNPEAGMGAVMADLRVLWSSKELPLAAVVAFGDTSSERTEAMKKALFALPKAMLDEIQSTGFVDPESPAYEAAEKAYAR
jgi:ABC-type phosphate/phosphonate transport system substrate-binding protein